MREPRTVVVDDSRFMRGLITDLLDEGGVPVVGEAADGREAIEVVRREEPDVVTMDVEMPEMNGIEALERIMDEQPTPVLMLSAYTEDGAEVTFEALEKGAVDFFAKPGGEVSMGVSRQSDQLVETVRKVADADLDRATRSDNGASPRGPEADSATAETTAVAVTDPFEEPHTIVIGSSTGGPNAVEEVLGALPAGDCRVLVVQHMPEAFTTRFAERLDAASDYDVAEAADGARIGRGKALVARGGSHMEVTNYNRGRLRVALDDDDRGHSTLPAVDVTMASVAEVVTDPIVGVVLTGMGADGAEGICAIDRAGGRTIAQDEATSVIYGMPKRAAETGCVGTVCGLSDVAGAIVNGDTA